MTAARARVALLAVAVLFSTGGVAIKWTSASSWQVASLRSLVAAITLYVLLRPDLRRLTPRVLAIAATYAATMVLFVQANKLTTAANTIFLQSTAPLYLAVLAPWLLKERLRRRDLRLMALLALGIALVLAAGDVGSQTAPDPTRGNLFAALAGACWALTLLGLRALGSADSSDGADRASHKSAHERASDETALCVVAGNAIAALVGLPFALPLAGLTPDDGLAILFLGSIQIGLAYYLLTRAIASVPALESSLLLLVEPALSPLWTWWALSEAPAPLALAGGAVIVIGTAIHIVSTI